jgi:hypothetical protein
MNHELNHSAVELQQFDAAHQSLVATIEGLAKSIEGFSACVTTAYHGAALSSAAASPAQR